MKYKDFYDQIYPTSVIIVVEPTNDSGKLMVYRQSITSFLEQGWTHMQKIKTLKRQSDLRASFTHLAQNYSGNSLVAIIIVKNVRLRNGGHFKIEPPKSRGAICDQTVSLIKKWEKIDPHNFLILEGVYFLHFFIRLTVWSKIAF